LDSDGADALRVAMSVDEGTPEITYLVSNSFRLDGNGDTGIIVTLIEADTVTVALPMDEQFPTGVDQRLFFRVLDRSNVDDLLRMNVWLGDEPNISQGYPPNDDIIQLLYLFGGGVTDVLEITVL
jgi:hypothetical protein